MSSNYQGKAHPSHPNSLKQFSNTHGFPLAAIYPARRHGALLAVFTAALLLPSMGRAAGKHDSAAPAVAASAALNSPSPMEKVYQDRAARNPQDVEAFAGLAVLQVRRHDYPDAIASYRRVLDLAPHDHSAELGLGWALAFSGQYPAALLTFQDLLKAHAHDADALEGVARVQIWRGEPAGALLIFQSLAESHPQNAGYAVGVGRAQMDLHLYADAQKTLKAVVAAHPGNADAQLEMAYLDMYQGRYAAALRGFNALIRQDPGNTEALMGNARVAYFRGDLDYARNLAAKIVNDDPANTSALLLLANLERALHRRGQARQMLERAESFNPHNPEAEELANHLRDDSRPTLHTSASFAREIGSSSAAPEDLTAFGYGDTWGFFFLPRTDSFVSTAYLPSQSPSGGIQGAVGPEEVFYRQTTYLTSHFTVRGGAGFTRFGPGDLVTNPLQAVAFTSAGFRPSGLVGLGYALNKQLKLDLTAARDAAPYTPTAVRLGVMEDRLSAGLDYQFDAKTDLTLAPFVSDFFSIGYNHGAGIAGGRLLEAEHNRGGGGSITFNHKLWQRPGFSADAGYSGLAYESAGGSENPYLGIFNPKNYQRHYLTGHVAGKLRGPLGYDFYAGAGVQQVNSATPLKPALLLTPALTYHATARHSLTLSYTHYDSSQALGTLRGNAVRLATDWRF